MNSDIIRLLESKEDSMSRLDYREARASVEWGLKHGLLKKPAPMPERVVLREESGEVKPVDCTIVDERRLRPKKQRQVEAGKKRSKPTPKPPSL